MIALCDLFSVPLNDDDDDMAACIVNGPLMLNYVSDDD